jgi:hypothetical protein
MKNMSNTKTKVMNTLPDIADDNGNNCPVAINYVNKYIIIVLQIVNFSFFFGKLIKITMKKLLICINTFLYLKKYVDTK